MSKVNKELRRNKLNRELNETKTNLKMSWEFIKKEKKTLIIMIIFSIFLSVTSVIIPVLTAQLLIKLSSNLLTELLKVAIFIFVIETSRNLISVILQKITESYMIRTVIDIQMKLFQETLKIETSEIDKNTSGVFIDRINNDSTGIINIFSRISNNIIDFLSNFGVLIAVFLISKYMFFYFLVTTLILNFISKKRRSLFYEVSKNYRSTSEKRSSLTSEIIRGARDVKLLNASEGILKRTKLQLDEIGRERQKMSKIECVYSFLSNTIRDLFDVSFFALGVFLVKEDNLSISNFIILYTYRNRIESLLSIYNNIADILKSYNLSATRVFEILGDNFKKEEDIKDNIDVLNGNIEFKNVCFAYEDENVLKNVSFKINHGERIGFVGVSGSGKSTIFNLITKLYRVKEGKILIDNIDINEISPSSIRKNISFISQSPYLFNFTIEENLKISNPNATDEEIVDACKQAYIYDHIMELDDKFKTYIGEGGVILSGGEKQRVAIARSLLQKSKVILFDEATSALDNITQNKVQKAIYGLDKDKTVLIIAHRLSTIINCDRIIVIDDGRILDIGTHDELLGRCKHYQDLYKYEERNNG